MTTRENNTHQFPANRGASTEGPTVLLWLVWSKY
jgi:hypothetical protein